MACPHFKVINRNFKVISRCGKTGVACPYSYYCVPERTLKNTDVYKDCPEIAVKEEPKIEEVKVEAPLVEEEISAEVKVEKKVPFKKSK